MCQSPPNKKLSDLVVNLAANLLLHPMHPPYQYAICRVINKADTYGWWRRSFLLHLVDILLAGWKVQLSKLLAQSLFGPSLASNLYLL